MPNKFLRMRRELVTTFLEIPPRKTRTKIDLQTLIDLYILEAPFA